MDFTYSTAERETMIRTIATFLLLTTTAIADELPKAPAVVSGFSYRGVSFNTPESAMRGKPIDRMYNMSLWKLGSNGEVQFTDGRVWHFSIDIPKEKIRTASSVVDKMSKSFGKQPDIVSNDYYVWKWRDYSVMITGNLGVWMQIEREEQCWRIVIWPMEFGSVVNIGLLSGLVVVC